MFLWSHHHGRVGVRRLAAIRTLDTNLRKGRHQTSCGLVWLYAKYSYALNHFVVWYGQWILDMPYNDKKELTKKVYCTYILLKKLETNNTFFLNSFLWHNICLCLKIDIFKKYDVACLVEHVLGHSHGIIRVGLAQFKTILSGYNSTIVDTILG